MNTWEEFELKCLNYLCNKFGDYATFEAMGSTNPTVSDIKAITNHGKEFFIEVKESPAQCGQFVLIPEDTTKTFHFSAKNFSKSNAQVQKIINFMNLEYDKFRNAGTKGEKIIFPSSNNIFAQWIIDYYKTKNVEYIITNDFILFPVEKISDYFDIECVYRIKKSGSSSIGLSSKNELNDYLDNLQLKNYRSYYNNKKLSVFTSDDIGGNTFSIKGNSYIFSRNNNSYEVRKLSNTCNANVIFSVKLKPNVIGLTDLDFINDIQNKTNSKTKINNKDKELSDI